MTDAEQKAFAQGRAAGLEEERIHCMFVEWYAMTQVQPAWSKDKGVPAAEWLGDIMKEKLARADRPRGSVDARFGVWCETGDYLRWEARELFSQFKVVFELARSALSPTSSDAGKDDARDAARYRWLRKWLVTCTGLGSTAMAGTVLDAAIDAALSSLEVIGKGEKG